MKELEFWLQTYSPDILYRIRRTRRNKILRILLVDVLLAVAVFMSRTAFVGKPFEIPVYITVGALILFMPLIVSPASVLFCKPWIGTVTDFEINSHATVGRKETAQRYGKRTMIATYRISEAVYVRYRVVDENGKQRAVVMPSKYAHCFLKGDRIAVFAELEYPINLTEHKGGSALCPLCASILHHTHKEECLHCGCRFDRNASY